jgi:uncharacterized protein (DUF983 family)
MNDLTSENRKYTVPHVSQWSAFIHAKCPRCRLGSTFTGAMYGFKVQKMKEVCEVCALKFEREPGYFYVSMFVSYAMNVAEIISLGVAAYVLGLDIVYENLFRSNHLYGRIAFCSIKLQIFPDGAALLAIPRITL